jgi:hypothetical protein
MASCKGNFALDDGTAHDNGFMASCKGSFALDCPLHWTALLQHWHGTLQGISGIVQGQICTGLLITEVIQLEHALFVPLCSDMMVPYSAVHGIVRSGQNLHRLPPSHL